MSLSEETTKTLWPSAESLQRERADDVVGLEALVAEDGDAEGFEGAADVGLLLGEVGGHLGAVGLVAGVVDRLQTAGS